MVLHSKLVTEVTHRPNPISMSNPSLPEMIDAVGTDHFDRKLLSLLNTNSGTEYFTGYRLRNKMLEVVCASSISGAHELTPAVGEKHEEILSKDPFLQAAFRAARSSKTPVTLHVDPHHLCDNPISNNPFKRHHVIDRILVCEQRNDDIYVLSLLRSHHSKLFSQADTNFLSEFSGTILAFVASHTRLVMDAKGKSAAEFNSVDRIENRMRTDKWNLTNRELQVCARILYGKSTGGIALDLGIREESVATYRKRAYHRLQISSRFELFHNYLRSL